jgi:ABC-type dipeptide/oligopeptide/nickel transport system ATPase component
MDTESNLKYMKIRNTPQVSEAILKVDRLSVTLFNQALSVKVVNQVSFELHSGETIAIVGASGSGKSTLAYALTRLLPPTAQIQGRVTYKDIQVTAISDTELRNLRGSVFAYIFQESTAALNPLLTVGFQISEVIQIHRPESSEIKHCVCALLKQVGLNATDRIYDSYPHALSGGMQQRVMIAMALAGNPKILIADEPTTALDVTLQKQILDLIKQLQSRTGMSILFVTHNLGIAARLADKILVMDAGMIVEQGPTEQILKHPQHLYTQELIASVPMLNRIVKPIIQDLNQNPASVSLVTRTR